MCIKVQTRVTVVPVTFVIRKTTEVSVQNQQKKTKEEANKQGSVE